jgi:urea transport system ATP-binding protein
MNASTVDPSELETSARPREWILTIEGLNKAFDGFQVIHDLNFYLNKGELRTIIGPNGAGKSTLLDMITGRTEPDSGTIEFGPDHQNDLTKLPEHKINRLGVARKFQSPSVYGEQTVYDNLLLSLPHSRGVFEALFYRESKADRDRIHEVLQTIRLEGKKNDLAGSLSHGQKQWLEIGMLLAQDPKLLLVDEPAAGMTDEETERTGELLLSLEGKHSIIVIEHDMEFVRQIARTVTVLHQGSVLCEGSVDKVQSDPKVIEVYLGRKHGRPETESS